MNGNPDDDDAGLFEDPLGIIPPPPPPAQHSEPVSFCDECGGIGLHLDTCPIHNASAWAQKQEKRERVLARADENIPRLVVIATRRVAARALRRFARLIDP